jgi:hypothetical protein
VAGEVLFKAEQQWQAFRDLPTVRVALDAVPDPVSGLLIYRGRGWEQMPASHAGPSPRPAPALFPARTLDDLCVGMSCGHEARASMIIV